MTQANTVGRPLPAREPLFEVRAVWDLGNHLVSQPAHQFDAKPMRSEPPYSWDVYVVHGGYIEEHRDRAAAETHCAQLNGETA